MTTDASPFVNIEKVVQNMEVSECPVDDLQRASVSKNQPEQEPIDPVSTQKDSEQGTVEDNNLTSDHYQ